MNFPQNPPELFLQERRKKRRCVISVNENLKSDKSGNVKFNLSIIMNLKVLSTVLVMTGIFVFSGITRAEACEIELAIVDNSKSQYSTGDEIIIKVEVKLTHRVCSEGIENTKFSSEGLKILGATKWTETIPGTFERKLKVVVTSNVSGAATLKASRSCDKDGGIGVIRISLIQ